MGRIHVLAKEIADLIAAGEVVERPASVVKELTENAIDAGASAITIEIQHGGVSYIRITDNGCGMEPDDVPRAFLSHATSKVRSAGDLDAILTLGFRGEALASVAAVARVEVLTRTPGGETGTAFQIAGGVPGEVQSAGCPVGTTIVVRDLFFNTPARMKFLKKDVSEANAVADVVSRLALSHPEISFRFIREGRQTLLTPGDGKLLSAIYSVLGRAFADQLIPVNYALDGVGVTGYISRPTASRPSRSMQFFFLNHRFIRARACAASMENAYKNFIMIGKFPSCVLNLEVPARVVDVNVHPAKTEVRFSDERKVSSAVYYAVRSALEVDETHPQADLSKLTMKPKPQAVQLQMAEDPLPAAPPRVKAAAPSPAFWNELSAADFRKQTLASPRSGNRMQTAQDEPDVLSGYRKRSVAPAPPDPQPSAPAVPQQTQPKVTVTDAPPKPPLRLIGEAFKTYILCEYDGKLCMIDKHAAHERVIFNRIKANQTAPARQALLTPVTVTLSGPEYTAALEQTDAFAACGFLIEDFGGSRILVRECPMQLDAADVEDVVMDIAANILLTKTDAQSDLIDRICATAACKAAIKAGNNNSPAELLALAERVLYHNDVRYCPHGRPTVIEMSRYDLEKQFGRIQG
ncbi:MAG: DNA mismatch repair endonuclease MutL [Clostridia bacterium]|nr:DNA mismatch repair endonuclease MutL [Clostridia bacterium]